MIVIAELSSERHTRYAATMARLFVALTPPAAMRAALLAQMGGVAAAKWQSDVQLHVTLAFLGDVHPSLFDGLDAALAAIHAPAFEMWCEGIGSFAKKGMVHTLWAGAAPASTIAALAAKTRHAVQQVGVAIEAREFVPHVTLARLNSSAGPVDGFLEHAARLRTATGLVTRFGLYESRLNPDGARYDLLASYPLA